MTSPRVQDFIHYVENNDIGINKQNSLHYTHECFTNEWPRILRKKQEEAELQRLAAKEKAAKKKANDNDLGRIVKEARVRQGIVGSTPWGPSASNYGPNGVVLKEIVTSGRKADKPVGLVVELAKKIQELGG